MALYCPDLMCEWQVWRVLASDHLVLHVPHGHCPNMRGAIVVAQRLLPAVDAIDVYSGQSFINAYRRNWRKKIDWKDERHDERAR